MGDGRITSLELSVGKSWMQPFERRKLLSLIHVYIGIFKWDVTQVTFWIFGGRSEASLASDTHFYFSQLKWLFQAT